MCGIFAAVSAGPRLDPVRLAAATEALAHRGPDGVRLALDPSGTIALGHRLLGMRGASLSPHPLASEDGAVRAVVNGEIYGHRALRRQLAQAGHRFATDSDAEVVVHLYEELGAGLAAELDGEFALVVHDRRRGRLVAARDRFGVKPLVFHAAADLLLVASEAKALHRFGVPAAWDEVALAGALAVQYPPADRTLFRGIAALPPGHALIADGVSARVEPYAAPAFGGPPRPLPADPVASLRGALTEAVRVRLETPHRLAVSLSGGVDSGVVLALAAPARPTAYTLALGDADTDERPRARRTAARLGLSLVEVEAGAEARLAALPAAVAATEGLAINGHLPAKFLLHRAIRAGGARAVLSGEGADELFLGYPHLTADLATAAGRPAPIPLPAVRGVMIPDGPGLDVSAAERALGFVPTFLAAKAAIGRRLAPLFRPSPAPLAAHAESLARAARPAHRVHRAAALWAELAFASYLTRTLGDGTEMAHGLEGRLPFLDPAVVAVAEALPADRPIDRPEKALLREAFADALDPEVRRAPKQPLLTPPTLELARPRARAFVLDLLASEAFLGLPGLERPAARRFAAELARADRTPPGLEPALFLLVSAALLAASHRL